VPDMSAQEIWGFLCAGTRTAHVATTRSDGRPHVKPVWFVLDGRPGDFQLVFTTYAGSVKGRGLRSNASVAVSVDDPAPPYSFVIVEGTAQVSDRLDQVHAAAIRIVGRYMGAGRAAEFGARNGMPGELLGPGDPGPGNRPAGGIAVTAPCSPAARFS
jgi:PPOX class probable F420-dependent enzyme